MKIIRKNPEISIIIFILFILICNILFPSFYYSSHTNLLIAVIITIYSIMKIQNRLGLLFFVLSLILFLISRPIIDIYSNYSHFYPMHYSNRTAIIANMMILVTMLFIFIGYYIYKEYISTKVVTNNIKINYSGILSFILVIGVIITFISLNLTVVEKIVYRRTNSYTDLYANFQSVLPFVVRGFSAIAVTLIVLKVSYFGNKRVTYILLGVYLLINFILMFTGVRANFIKTLLFVTFVFLIKERLELDNKKKLIKNLSIIFLISVLLISILQFTESTRATQEKKANFPSFVQFVYNQGISYMSLTRGQELKSLDTFKSKQYTIGPFLDQFGNAKKYKPYTLDFVKNGDSFAADIAYYLYKENALKGYGLGSSYLIELYSDFGFIGISIYSVLLGVLLGSLTNINFNNIVLDSIKLRILLEIFYIPRAPAMQFIVNIFVPQFWLPVVAFILIKAIYPRFIRSKVGSSKLLTKLDLLNL